MVVDSARRRVVTDVSLSRRLASTQCFRRRRATSACSARRTLAAYLSSAVCGAVSRSALSHARRPYEPSRTSSDVSWKSLRGAAQRAQHTGGRSPSVEPLDSCLCPPARRVASIPCVRFRFCVWGFRPPVCAAPGLPGRGATSSLLLSNIFFQLLYGVVLWWSTPYWLRGVTKLTPPRAQCRTSSDCSTKRFWLNELMRAFSE